MPSSIISDGGFVDFLGSLKGISERHPRYTASLILSLAFGHHVNSTDQKYVQLSETAVSGTIEYGNPGAQIVDLFP